MNTQQQEALDAMIREVKQLPQIASLSSNTVISRLKINLIDVGDQVNRSNHQLVAAASPLPGRAGAAGKQANCRHNQRRFRRKP